MILPEKKATTNGNLKKLKQKIKRPETAQSGNFPDWKRNLKLLPATTGCNRRKPSCRENRRAALGRTNREKISGKPINSAQKQGGNQNDGG